MFVSSDEAAETKDKKMTIAQQMILDTARQSINEALKATHGANFFGTAQIDYAILAKRLKGKSVNELIAEIKAQN